MTTTAADVLELIERARSRSRVEIPPGRYVIPGADNFTIKNLYGTEFIADGVTFVFEPLQSTDSISMVDCQNVTWKGLTIDYDPCPFSQGTVTAINTGANSFDWTVEAGYPAIDSSWSDDGGGNTKCIAFDANGQLVKVRMDWAKTITSLGGGSYRIITRGGYLMNQAGNAFAVGNRVCLPNRIYRHCVLMRRAASCRWLNCDMYASNQMGWVEIDCTRSRYENCRVMRAPGTTRLLTTNADAFHSYNAVVAPTWKNCYIEYNGDDGINSHAWMGLLYSYSAGVGKLLVSEEKFAYSGSPVRLYNSDGTNQRTTTITSSSQITDATQVSAARTWAAGQGYIGGPRTNWVLYSVTFAGGTPATGNLVENQTYMPSGAVVDNTIVKQNFGRGLIVKSHNSTFRENVVIGVANAAMHLGPHLTWGEAPIPDAVVSTRNVVVRSHQLMFQTLQDEPIDRHPVNSLTQTQDTIVLGNGTGNTLSSAPGAGTFAAFEAEDGSLQDTNLSDAAQSGTGVTATVDTALRVDRTV